MGQKNKHGLLSPGRVCCGFLTGEVHMKSPTPLFFNNKLISICLFIVVCLAACSYFPSIKPSETAALSTGMPATPGALPSALRSTSVVVLSTLTTTPTVLPSLTLTSTATPTFTFTPLPSPTRTPTRTLEPPSTAKLALGPYLQSVYSDSIQVIWDTDKPARGAVAYGEAGEYTFRLSDPDLVTHHVFNLVDLKPYTLYSYRVESGSTILSHEYTFRTAADSQQDNFRFAVYGDTRGDKAAHQSVIDRMDLYKPDFAIHTGDLVDDGQIKTYWKIFFQVEGNFLAHVPLYPTLGNHEQNAPNYFNTFSLPGNQRWYFFDYGKARFICLEFDQFENIVDPQQAQLAWLEQTLADNTQPWLFVYFHVPNIDLGSGISQSLKKMFEKYKVNAVFSGHEHNYQRRVENGITYIISGGGGAPLYRIEGKDKLRAAAAVMYHFLMISVEGKTLTGSVITPKGVEIDQFTLTLPPR